MTHAEQAEELDRIRKRRNPLIPLDGAAQPAGPATRIRDALDQLDRKHDTERGTRPRKVREQ